ncbi:hypothetical protein LZ30DRAFT_739144 [Colletotrichum cereale]|nr:hypothetical protein LZ30DRAFT_739144 [Colletotrichum cereale]
MHSTYLLLLHLWLLLSYTSAAPTHLGKGLRYDNDIYTVKSEGDAYDIYTPNFFRGEMAVTKLIFPTDNRNLITIASAWNGREKAHTDGSPRLHLSDIIQVIASNRHANRPLQSVNRIHGQFVVNEESIDIIDRYFDDWRKRNPDAEFPEKLTITPSSPFWPSLLKTQFFKAVTWTFAGTEKTVKSIYIVPQKGSYDGHRNFWFHGANMGCNLE